MPASIRGGWSLERKLTLFILLLLAGVVVALGATAYNEVRSAAVARTLDRLEGLAREVATSSARNTLARTATVQAVASSAAVGNAVVAGSVSTATDAALATALAGLRRAADTTLIGWEVWTASGARLYRSAPMEWVDSTQLAGLRANQERRDSVQRSPLYAVQDRIHLWSAYPVLSAGRMVGYLAELRRLPNSARAEETIRRVTGDEVRVYYASEGSRQWASLRGEPMAAPYTLPAQDGIGSVSTDSVGGRHYVVRAIIPGSPWMVVMSQSEAYVLQRPAEFLRRMLWSGLLLLAIGTFCTWLLSRHFTRPLADFDRAAEAMAQGDYTHRMRPGTSAEMSRLADTFNAMATRIGDSHAVLEHQNAALQRANDAKTRFLAMMSHELRTPLNAIGGYTDLMAMGVRGPTTAAQVDDLARIRRNKDQLLNIIADILHFARVDAGHVALKYERLHVRDLFSALADSVGPQYGEKGVALEFGDTDCTIDADPGRLHQVMLNLITNAFNFTPSGGRVRVDCGSDAGYITLRVSDTGIGIPAEKITTIFDPFIQVDSSLTRKIGGTGLGLAIARELAAAMGGTISVTSVVGEGSTFSLSMPMARRVSIKSVDAGADTVTQ